MLYPLLSVLSKNLYSFEELKDAIDKYIRYYNEKRGKASLGYMSPIEYRKKMLAA